MFLICRWQIDALSGSWMRPSVTLPWTLEHLKVWLYPGIFKSPDFKLFQDAIDSEMKTLKRKGVGVTTKQAEPIMSCEEVMWVKGMLGDAQPRTLLYTLVFLFGKFFAL